jgi:two-component system CheB/CheR fusion protein
MATKGQSPERRTDGQPAHEQPTAVHDRQAQPIATEEPPRLPFPVVGIGASAGGLEAFIEFFDTMPDDSGIAFVLIQHLPPDRESLVADIISKHTRMPVREVADKMSVEVNHVYVIRPGHTLTIADGMLHLGAPLAKPGHGRPVDDFFRSLAEEQRERAICIVMSGMGSNGSSGAETVKAVGGVAIAQDPESAKYSSMPRHLIDTGNADFILRPNEMPAVLVRYASHSYVREREAAETAIERQRHQLNEILTALRARTRRDFSGYKKPTVLRRIQRRMSLNQIDELGDYAKLLRQNPSEASALADDLMIHVTGFFRDPEAWEALREKVIVPLVEERETGSSIRCWIAACSSGEEAFTLSMLLEEAADQSGKTFDIKVLATDTADRSLSMARTGTYPLGIESEIPSSYLARYFVRDDSVYRVKRELRELVVFAPQNVIQDPPFSRLDICSCRNLLIYLEPDLQRRILSLLHFGLREGGVLFLGSSETVNGAEELFETIDKRSRIFRRVGPTRHGTIGFAFPAALEDGGGAAAAPARTPLKPTINQLTNHLLLERYTPAAVTIDREHRIVYFHGDTNPYLQQPVGEPTRELLAVVRDHVRGALRTAIHKAMSERQVATARTGVMQRAEGRFRIAVTVTPFDEKLASGHCLVTFAEIEEQAPPPPLSGTDTNQEAARLQDELTRVREELQSTIEELQSSNEEMKASNEEAMSINEELQSTNEELETSKEELQSLNEELTTLNVQLQTKMEELEATSSDLSSLLTSTDIAVMFLDTRLRIRRFTPAIADLFQAIPSDVGRPLSDLAEKFSDPQLLADSQAVLDRLVPVEREIVSGTGQVYLRRTLPYRTGDNRINGVVITFINISERKQTEDALRASEDRFRVVVEGAPDFAMLLLDAQGRIVSWNVGAERLLGWSADEAIGKSASIIYPPADAAADLSRRMHQAAEFGRGANESWYVRKAGSRFWGSGVMTAVHGAGGKVTGYVKVLRDETARKQAEAERAELLEREKAARQEAENATRSKDQFLAMLSHELRTPIASILLWARMLREKSCDEAERDEGLQVIERGAEAQKQLLDDLLDVSRIAAGKVRLEREETNMLEVVKLAIESARPVAKAKEVRLKSELAADIGMIDADANRLRQVVGNLLNNAIKFTSSGGLVEVRLNKSDHWIELSVSDTGVGIEPEFLPRVFTAFSQADASSTRAFGGLGLGLAISKELVELHGGTIHAESGGPGQGATFVVRLPVAGSGGDFSRPRRRSTDEEAVQSIAGARVLLVEDEPQTRDALEKLMRKNGADVTAVGTTADALAAFENARPDIIISDIGLPHEDGYHLLQRIRSLEMERHEPPTPSIALTAFAGRKDRRMARDSGYHKHIAKPVSPAVLLAAVSTLLADRERAVNGG